MNTRSLYFRLILWYSGLVILVLLAFAAYTYEGVRVRLYGEMEKTLARRAQQVADNVLIHEGSESPQEIAHQIREVYSPAANNRFIRILRADRSVLYVSDAPKDGSFDPLAVPLPSPQALAQRIEILPSGTNLLMVDLPVTVAGKGFRIEMGAPTHEMQTALHGLLVTLLFGLPMVVIIVSAGGYALVRRSLKPVEDIRATAEQITFGNLSNRLPVAATGDALENLSVTLNQMLERLEDAYQQVSRFSADASHELRTPLTIMRGELESIIQRESGLPDRLRERIGSVLEETERLSHIAESLFAICRLDAGEGKAKPTTFYLIDLVKTTADQMLLLAEDKAIKVFVENPRLVKISGDEARLKQVVVNLLDNAIKYTPKGGGIRISVTEAHHKAVLSITDSGIGISPEALPHIFERFYRADKARSREQGGAGLGLSIVRSIVQAHGGTVEVESVEQKGTTCRVILPLADNEG
jgi:heavy metal sensor kinase